MKTSNKLLVGLFLFLVVSVIGVNVVLKNEINSNSATTPAQIQQQENTHENMQDSINIEVSQ